MLATPCAISSAFELCRSPHRCRRRPRRAGSRPPPAAPPSSPTAAAAGSDRRGTAGMQIGGKPVGMPPNLRSDGLHRQAEDAATASVADDERHDRARERAAATAAPAGSAPARPTRAPTAAGLNVSAAPRRAAAMRAKNSLGTRRCCRPRKSLICVEAISRAMPLVKPRTTGRGMNLTACAEAGDAPGTSRMTPAIIVTISRPESAVLRDDAGDDDDERPGRPADLDRAIRRAPRRRTRRRWPCRCRPAASRPMRCRTPSPAAARRRRRSRRRSGRPRAPAACSPGACRAGAAASVPVDGRDGAHAPRLPAPSAPSIARVSLSCDWKYCAGGRAPRKSTGSRTRVETWLPTRRLTTTCRARSTARCWERLACSTPSRSGQRAGVQLAVAELVDDGDAGRVREGLEEAGLERAEL